MAAMRPSLTATSATNGSPPVPSTTRPLRMTRSNISDPPRTRSSWCDPRPRHRAGRGRSEGGAGRAIGPPPDAEHDAEHHRPTPSASGPGGQPPRRVATRAPTRARRSGAARRSRRGGRPEPTGRGRSAPDAAPAAAKRNHGKCTASSAAAGAMPDDPRNWRNTGAHIPATTARPVHSATDCHADSTWFEK